METTLLEPARPAGAEALRPAGGADFSPALRSLAARAAAEACLEEPFKGALEDRLSFLVNGFWLIGRHRIREYEAADPALADGLRALGHEVETRGGGADSGEAAGHDRAMLISRALGYAGDGDPVARLKAMQRALRPGGLILFHVLDRDRAWSLVRDFTSREGAAGIAFDPRSGEVTVRIRPMEGTEAAPGGRQAVRTFNLGEVGALLGAAGLKLERAYGGWSGGSVEEEGELTGRILVVASKPRKARKAPRRPAAGRAPVGAEGRKAGRGRVAGRKRNPAGSRAAEDWTDSQGGGGA
jgi:hypothetical protein